MKKRLLIISLIFILVITFLSGCSQALKGNPDDAINTYFEGMKNANYEQSYDILCDYNKEHIDKDSYVLMNELESEYAKIKDVKITMKNRIKDYTFDDLIYSDAVEYDVSQTDIRYDEDNKENTDTYNSTVVYENGLWKLCIDNYDVNLMISDRYLGIGWMYANGIGKSKNTNEAAINAKKAIEYYSKNADAYYLLGYAYMDLKRYEDAIKAATEGILMTDDNNLKSDFAVVMGLASEYLGEYGYAKTFYTEAINFNPSNEYAKTNLNNLQ